MTKPRRIQMICFFTQFFPHLGISPSLIKDFLKFETAAFLRRDWHRYHIPVRKNRASTFPVRIIKSFSGNYNLHLISSILIMLLIGGAITPFLSILSKPQRNFLNASLSPDLSIKLIFLCPTYLYASPTSGASPAFFP